MNLKSLAAQHDDFGETFYLVDANYRTQAQNWTTADRTGPLDLYLERNPGRVFGSGTTGDLGYATDAAAAQAAIDAAVDFRGDKIFFTPGSYSIATALTINAAGLRLVGPPVRHPRRSAVTVTDTVGAAFTVSVDDVEIGHMTVIPKTAQKFLSVANGADYGVIHHVHYNAVGVAASTSTEFCNAAATTLDWLVQDSVFTVDAAQGDAFTLATATRWVIERSHFFVVGSGVAWASVMTLGTACLGVVVQDCGFWGTGGATPAVFTNIFTGQTNSNGQLRVIRCMVDGTALSTAGDIETGFGTTTDIELAECYQTGDATAQGGTLITLT